MNLYHLHGKNRRTKLWVGLILLTMVMLLLSIWLMGPSPPKKIIMATGEPGRGYATFGKKYKTQLEKMGLEVKLVNTNGSIDNLEQLIEGKVDVAFAQGGTYQLVTDKDPDRVVRGLVAIYSEPLWVFYRGSKPVPGLSAFAHPKRKIAIGPPESGTEAVAEILLRKHGITAKNADILNMSAAEARTRLKNGTLDVGIFISSSEDPGIKDLLRQKHLLLLNFQHHDIAHSRIFPYLKPVKLAAGILDLKDDIPREEETLLAPAALLVCREDLHPRVVEQLLKAANKIHSPGNLIDPANRFPTLEGVDIQIHESSETYMKSGESFLSRHLPYWAVRLLLQMRILILPVLAIWIPFLKIVPMIYNYRVNGLLKRHYAALREAESAIAQAETADQLRQRVEVLERLRTDMEALSRKVPAHLQRDVYHWRLHVSLVHAEALARLRRMEENDAPAGAEPPIPAVSEH
jgi:TRAP transporter TAXI family solute receptor